MLCIHETNHVQTLDKTPMKLPASNRTYVNLNKGYGNNKIKVVGATLLGLQIEGNLNSGGELGHIE
jgi:hypothetical protein